MIKYIVVSVITLFLVSCTQVNTTGEKTITQDSDTVAEVDISLSKYDAITELAEIDEEKTQALLFKASGIEPGWFAEIYDNKLRLVVDYGEDSLILDNKFEGLDDKNGYLFNVEGNKNKAKNVQILLINKPCIDAGSGDKKDRQVSVLFKGKKYMGCGSFVK